MDMLLPETQMDGLVGPTHNYAGLSFGNVASEKHALSASNPKKAALEGLRKMKFVHDLGVPQLVMPPQPRPAMKILRDLGIDGVEKAPEALLHQVYSASAMWVANAATVSPSADCADGKVHITPANLASKFHRFMEADATASLLKRILPSAHFIHHPPLPAHAVFADEGAANHMRLCRADGGQSTEIFVYGETGRKYPARQSLPASRAIAEMHRLERAVFLRQGSAAIDAGVFHNDVIAMSHRNLLVHHEAAYEETDAGTLDGFTRIVIREKELSLENAVSTYFFNSQLVSLPSGKTAVIAPGECEENDQARACFEKLAAEGHVAAVHYLDVRESMKNGGGPACLRLRLPLEPAELSAVNKNVLLDNLLFNTLCRWIETHYRDRIIADDLRDPSLARESLAAVDGLYTLLGLETA
jgi:succinylarginine dihydrolase